MATYGTFVDGVSLKAAEVNDFFVWTSFTGVVKQNKTVGASTNRCRYAKVNKLIHVTYNFAFNDFGNAGFAVEVNLPFNAPSSSSRVVGFGTMSDASTLTSYELVPVLSSTTAVRFLTSTATSLTSYFGLTNGPAITLDSDNDSINFSIVYETA